MPYEDIVKVDKDKVKMYQSENIVFFKNIDPITGLEIKEEVNE